MAYGVLSENDRADGFFETVLYSPVVNITDFQCLQVLVTVQPYATLSIHQYGRYNTTLFQGPWMPEAPTPWTRVSDTCAPFIHYCDVIMGAMASQAFIQAQIKENIKAPRHWPLCGEFTGGRWIPRTNDQ